MSSFKKLLVVTTGATFIVLGTGQAEALTLFTDRQTFENQLGSFIIDDYSSPGYLMGDQFDFPFFDRHSNNNMSNVLRETRYTSTGFNNNNIIFNQPDNPFYCAGCNGSFLLDFTSTSVGSFSGIFGAGFDIIDNTGNYIAFATLRDNSTANFALPPTGFFGITSDTNIRSIHIGNINGQARQDGYYVMDNLTIGNTTAVPFEFSPGVGILALGFYGAISQLKDKIEKRKKMKIVSVLTNQGEHTSH